MFVSEGLQPVRCNKVGSGIVWYYSVITEVFFRNRIESVGCVGMAKLKNVSISSESDPVRVGGLAGSEGPAGLEGLAGAEGSAESVSIGAAPSCPACKASDWCSANSSWDSVKSGRSVRLHFDGGAEPPRGRQPSCSG